MRSQSFLALTLLVVAPGCGDDVALLGDAPSDQALYETPHSDGNTFSCATCHALREPSADGLTRPGHPIGDAATRTSFKNGQLTRLLDAVNTCREDWLGAPAFTEVDPRWVALEEFLTAEAEGTAASELSYTIGDPPDDVSGGDPITGESTFNRTCSVCHGESGAGTERAPQLAGTPSTAEFIGMKVRRSGNPDSPIYPNLIPGRMPFWAPDRMSDEELRDVIAFLLGSEAVTPVTVTGEEEDLSLPNAQTNCASSHPSVGKSLIFQTNSHAVAGTATVVDDCTIRFDDFSFDGGGIDVHVYGGTNGDYDNGPDLSINMVGTAFDNGEAVVRLPTGITLDNFDGLSIWCVPVGFSFGDGQFQ